MRASCWWLLLGLAACDPYGPRGRAAGHVVGALPGVPRVSHPDTIVVVTPRGLERTTTEGRNVELVYANRRILSAQISPSGTHAAVRADGRIVIVALATGSAHAFLVDGLTAFGWSTTSSALWVEGAIGQRRWMTLDGGDASPSTAADHRGRMRPTQAAATSRTPSWAQL